MSAISRMTSFKVCTCRQLDEWKVWLWSVEGQAFYCTQYYTCTVHNTTHVLYTILHVYCTQYSMCTVHMEYCVQYMEYCVQYMEYCVQYV